MVCYLLGDFMIGLIVAEPQEMEAIKLLMKNISLETKFNLNLYIGTIQNTQVLLVRSGVGKVNAARVCQLITDNYNLDLIINLGSAGALNDTLKIGDIVIGQKLVQHDFDVTAFGRAKGFIPESGLFFESDKDLIKRCNNIKINNINVVHGIIGSADIFVTDTLQKQSIIKEFNCDCVEMEGASIAQVCFLNKIPFLVFRSISDTPNGNNNIDFNEYLKLASKNCATFILELIKTLEG